MEATKLVFIVYDEAIQPDVMEVLEARGLQYYTTWTGAQGAGETGRKEGNPIWPGLNNMLMVAMEESAVEPMIDAMHAMQQSFPLLPGLRFMITDAVFV